MSHILRDSGEESLSKSNIGREHTHFFNSDARGCKIA